MRLWQLDGCLQKLNGRPPTPFRNERIVQRVLVHLPNLQPGTRVQDVLYQQLARSAFKKVPRTGGGIRIQHDGNLTQACDVSYVIDVIKLRASMGAGTPEEKIAGASLWNADIKTIEQADWWLSTIIWLLLSQDRYEAALYLLLGPEMYDPRPSTVRTIFALIRQYSEVAILGGKEQGKTYSCAAWLIADWLRDVEWTCVRVLSVTGSHARNNAFSSIQRFYDESLVPLPGLSQKDFLGLDTRDRHASIQVLPLQPGETKNTLVGCHPVRRKQRHAQFSVESRVRIYADEAEMLPEGAYRGFLNVSKGNIADGISSR
jgi:hypothetical protein